MKKLILMLSLIGLSAQADVFTYSGYDFDGTAEQAKAQYEDALSSAIPAGDRKFESFESDKMEQARIYGSTQLALRDYVPVYELNSKGMRYTPHGIGVFKLNENCRIHRRWCLGVSTNDWRTWLSPSGFTATVKSRRKKLYGACATFTANAYGVKAYMVVDGTKVIPFDEEDRRVYNPNYREDGIRTLYPERTMCFIDTDGFKSIAMQTQENANDHARWMFTDAINYAGPVDYTPDFSALLNANPQPAPEPTPVPEEPNDEDFTQEIIDCQNDGGTWDDASKECL